MTFVAVFRTSPSLPELPETRREWKLNLAITSPRTKKPHAHNSYSLDYLYQISAVFRSKNGVVSMQYL
jgi:hypothetical protein